MLSRVFVRHAKAFSICGLALAAFAGSARSEDFYLAEGGAFPGWLLQSAGTTAERIVHFRASRPDPAYPRAVMKLAQVAVGPDGKAYYVSGLDGSLMHLLDGRHEIQVFEFPGQIRDLACTGEEHTVYFSAVPTPQNGEPLADGRIYRLDLWEGRPTEIAVINQAEIGGNWWGTFAIHSGSIHIVTFEDRSRIFQLAGGRPVQVFADNGSRIQGLTVGADGSFYFTTGSGKVYRTDDFVRLETAIYTERSLTDVALRAAADALRP